MKNLLLTGGAGYIGSHTVIELLNSDYQIVIIDDLSNANIKSIEAIKKITKKAKNLIFYQLDLKDESQVEGIFIKHSFDAVIHFAGYKAVAESVQNPLAYYENNLFTTLNLLKLMARYGVYRLVFSSSATVYAATEESPLKEGAEIDATNPYGRTKQYIEIILRDLAASDPRWQIICLRYFNPLGAHESGEIGEDPNGIPNNLAPYIAQVAVGKLPYLNIFGNDYPTPDGTGIRDYVHVCDLARGHRLAVEYLVKQENGLCEMINLGSGQGASVFEVLHCFEKVTEHEIPYQIMPRREGDNPVSIANIEKAKELLAWQPSFDIMKMCQDAWRWQYKHPNGFKA